jgi:hypothetical protein
LISSLPLALAASHIFLEGPSLAHGFESIASKGDGFRAGGYRVLYKNAAKNWFCGRNAVFYPLKRVIFDGFRQIF